MTDEQKVIMEAGGPPAEKAAAEKRAGSVWVLSKREKRIIERLGRT